MGITIRKWGNSLALRIPKTLAVEAGLENNSEVNLSIIDGNLVITPVTKDEELAVLLERVTDLNLHPEVSFGDGEGLETW